MYPFATHVEALLIHIGAVGFLLWPQLLTEYVLDQKLSKAAWPAWNTVLVSVRKASETMKQQALFRLPRVYRYSVKYLVASAIVTDSFILGARAGRLISYARSHHEWLGHAWFGSVVGFALNLLAVYFVSLLVQGLAIMEMPFSSDTLDSNTSCHRTKPGLVTARGYIPHHTDGRRVCIVPCSRMNSAWPQLRVRSGRDDLAYGHMRL